MTDSSTISLGLGSSHKETGDFDVIGTITRKNSHLTTIRAFTKLDHIFDNGASGYVQWFGNRIKTVWPGLGVNRSQENDIETQYNVEINDIHNISLGGNIRFVRVSSDQSRVDDLDFRDEPYNEEWGGLFLADSWEASKRLTLEMQLRGDYYSDTEIDWAGRVSSLLALDDEQKHILRFSGAKAYRAQQFWMKKVLKRELKRPYLHCNQLLLSILYLK